MEHAQVLIKSYIFEAILFDLLMLPRYMFILQMTEILSTSYSYSFVVPPMQVVHIY